MINAIKKAGIPLEEEKENNIIQNYRKGKRTLKIIPKKGKVWIHAPQSVINTFVVM